MKKFHLFLVLVLFFSACSEPEKIPEKLQEQQQTVLPSPKGPFTRLTILQMNDVYDIAPSRYDNLGGLARVASIQRKLVKENPFTLTVMCGDFLSPSVLGMLKDEDGNAYAGKPMVEVLNAVGVNYATFGNHEFDLSYEDLQARINESEFRWTTTNVFHKIPQGATYFTQKRGGADAELPQWMFHQQPDGQGGFLQMGILGMTLPFNQKDYVNYSQVYLATKSSLEQMIDKCQFAVALSHLEIESDREMAKRLPQLRLIMGGHDHSSMYERVGGTVIAKADANAKSIWVHNLKYYSEMDTLVVNSEKIVIDESIPEDPGVKEVVDKWMAIENEALKEMSYKPYETVATVEEWMDVRETSVRSKMVPMGQVIGSSFLHLYPEADCAILNGGSIRYDDFIEKSIAEKDVLNMLPFGGAIVELKMSGKDLQKTLDLGIYKNIGTGGFLQTANIFKQEGTWYVGKTALDFEQEYSVCMPEFLASGKEANLEYLGEMKSNKKSSFLDGKLKNDVRDILIYYLREEGMKTIVR
jgi:2',3'-cyclic-nucleotide 2'-phosphodiesterase (5'-nucleotidase family)